jgi:molecular chaperone GrpE
MTDDASDPTDAGTGTSETDPDRSDASATNGQTDAEVDPASDVEAEPTDAAAEGDGEADAETDGLAARVAPYDEDVAADVASLEARVEELEAELESKEAREEELASRLKRTQADFQNYKKRAKKKQDDIRERATADFVERVVKVRDNLVRALDQDEDADIRPGVESTLEEFDRILDAEDVHPIDPEPGTDVDPTRHEVMMRVDSDLPEGTVVDVYQPGYEMAGTVIREAQVTVSSGAE